MNAKSTDTTKGAPVQETRLCLCGCGESTRSRFAVGHDARLKSRLINAALEADSSKSDRRRAEKGLAELGWSSHLERSRAAREARALRQTATDTSDTPKGSSESLQNAGEISEQEDTM